MIFKQVVISSCVIIALLWGQITWLAEEVRAEAVKEITVSAAISLKNAFTEIGELFQESHPGVKVNFNFGASGDLMAQIRAGAPVEIFASAALQDMDQIEGEGFIVPSSRHNIATNEVVLVQPVKTSCPIQSFEDLKRAEINKIAVGNPKSVPAGRYAAAVFQYYQLSEPLKDKLILAENVRQVLDYVARGEVEAGIVYRTDAMTKAKEVKIAAAASEKSHKPVVYPLGVVKGSKNEVAAKEFIVTVLSAEGKAALKKYGFGVGP
jgi:molybdate transport system substrate-binding protein